MFNNPIKAQQLGTPSVASPVQDQSTTTALAGLADIIGTISDRMGQTQSGPDSWEVKSEWETEGSQAAYEDAQQYKFIKETEGASRAEVWRNKQELVRGSTLNADAADSYRQVIGDVLGMSKGRLEREYEIKEEQRVQSQMNDFKIRGRELAMAGGAKLGLDPEKLTDEQLIALAMTYNGNKAWTDEATRNVALVQSQMNLKSSERTLRSESAANNFLANRTTSTQALLFSSIESIRQNPSKADDIKLATVSQLEMEKARVLADASASILSSGGDISDVKSGQVEAITKQYDVAIALIRGDYQVDLLKTKLDAVTFGTALPNLAAMDSEMSKLVLTQAAVRMPFEVASHLLGKNGETNIYDPNSQYEVVRNLGLGINTAVQNTNQPPRKWVDTFVASVPAMAQNPKTHKDFGSTVVNTLAESFQAPLNIRQQASSPDSLPNLMGQLARTKVTPEMSEAVVQAAASEGMTPAELWQKSTVGVLREKIGPSLLKGDPFIMRNVDMTYSGGKFNLKINEQKYRQEANLVPNVSYYSGMNDATKIKIDKINKDLGIFQQFLNDSVQSYTKTVGGNPDDVGLALEQVVQVTFGLQNIK